MEENVETYDYSDILHMHCGNCYREVCSEQENCIMTRCLYCSISLHACKIDDHETICLLAQAACPNTGYGCSSKIVRREVAKHLETCPANVVHCGMEWNRYPLYSRERYTLTNIYNSQEGKMEQKREHWVPFMLINPPKVKGQLDTEFAISDQRKIAREKQKRMAIGKWKVSRGTQVSRIPQDRINKLAGLLGGRVCGAESPGKYGDLLDNQTESLPLEFVNIADSNSTNQSVKGYNGIDTNSCDEERGICKIEKQDNSECNIPKRSEAMVLRALKEEKLERERQATVTEERKGSVVEADNEPEVEFQECYFNSKPRAIRKALDSKEEKERIYQVEARRADFHTETEAVETQHPMIGVAQVSAQIHEQLKNALTEHLSLNVVIETIPKFQKNYPMYSVPCDVDLRRDQYCSHFKNIHDEIHGGLNYWIQQHCPLAQYGCSYIRHRLKPNSKGGLVVFDHDIDNFGIVPSSGQEGRFSEAKKRCFDLLSLPLELVERIALFLDNYSLNQFSKTCRTNHEICRNVLQRRGIVVIEWERGYYSNGSVLWRMRRKKWLFSPAFSEVSSWKFTDEPPMGEHLKKCRFFNRVLHRPRFPLPSLTPLSASDVPASTASNVPSDEDRVLACNLSSALQNVTSDVLPGAWD